MFLLDFIIWSPDPAIFTIPLSGIGLEDRPIVWYGLLFALGFITGQQIIIWIFRKEGRNPLDVDRLTTHMVVATVLGARLGHVLFYNPSYYLSHPIEILKIWEGGLASHGGALGIFLSLWLYVNYNINVKWLLILPTKISIKKIKREGQSFLWIVDRLVIVTALTGALIRTGNFMNSEMEGTPTLSDWGVVYARGTEQVLKYDDSRVEEVFFTKIEDPERTKPGYYPLKATMVYARGVEVDGAEKQFIASRMSRALKSYGEVAEHIDFGKRGEPLRYDAYQKGGQWHIDIFGVGTVRHTAQLYEAFYCIIIMVILLWVWKNHRDKVPPGFNFALFNIMLWTLRFVDEFFKMDQEKFEADLPLNMGQWLSIPLVSMGVILMIYIYRKKSKLEESK
ncbi:MAG: phosphatidylglycerol:prolipoprotein diacylglycerol transferase [Cyclobacteriaceae bacterium]|jgi:phosphatidylglycerol:prolipoprotein diacylglycerol transferase